MQLALIKMYRMTLQLHDWNRYEIFYFIIFWLLKVLILELINVPTSYYFHKLKGEENIIL
jgi:hypothetical protein